MAQGSPNNQWKIKIYCKYGVSKYAEKPSENASGRILQQPLPCGKFFDVRWWKSIFLLLNTVSNLDYVAQIASDNNHYDSNFRRLIVLGQLLVIILRKFSSWKESITEPLISRRKYILFSLSLLCTTNKHSWAPLIFNILLFRILYLLKY